MEVRKFFLIYLALALNTNCQQSDVINFDFASRNRLFDEGWIFRRDSLEGAEQPLYPDQDWRNVTLPHDYSIEALPSGYSEVQIGPFSKSSPGATATGYTIGGEGWYRKQFTLSPADQGKETWIIFDGVYMESDVWLNGNHLGFHAYGYTPFKYRLNDYLNPAGQENVLAVRVRNNGRNSRWYSGSGIYRHVWLQVTNSVYYDPYGVFITTPEIEDLSAKVSAEAMVINAEGKSVQREILFEILNQEGNPVTTPSKQSVKLEPGENLVYFESDLANPILWQPDQPNLYLARFRIENDGQIYDQYETRFGVRSLSFSAADGFLLNGKPVLMKGACIHHDNGLLGAATPDRAEYRKVELLKANGFNAIRTAHNPPSSQFLDACDQLGMLVIDEAFDHWEKPKNPQDYHRHFKEWHQADLQAMVRRDRNHPSVIMWSIGNEVNERADTSGVRIGRRLSALVKELDSTRPVNAANCGFWDHPGLTWQDSEPAFSYLDVGGYNYQWNEYESDHQKFPDRIMLGTESFPMEAWENWEMVKKHSYVIGDFVWTGMDYLGETGIGHTLQDNEETRFAMTWPWYNAWCGDLDLTGNKKSQSYYRDVVWGNSHLEMAVHAPLPAGRSEKISKWGWPDERQSWTWPGDENKIMDVNVYTSGDQVDLMLNGKFIGKEILLPNSKLTARFKVPYQPGELKAVAYRDGIRIGEKVLQTAGKPAVIELIPDRLSLMPDPNDLSYISIEIRDAQGIFVPDAKIPLRFEIDGPGEILAAGNGSPDDMASFRGDTVKTFRGRALVIVRPLPGSGKIKLKTFGKNLPDNELELVVQNKSPAF